MRVPDPPERSDGDPVVICVAAVPYVYVIYLKVVVRKVAQER